MRWLVLLATVAHAGLPVDIEGEYCPALGGCFAAEVRLERGGRIELFSPDLLYFTEGDFRYDKTTGEIEARFDDGSSLEGERQGDCFRGEFFSPALGVGDFEGCIVP